MSAVQVRIALIGDHDPEVIAHRAIPLALEGAAAELRVTVAASWIRTDAIDPADPAPAVAPFDALWCTPASPYRSTEGALAAIRWAREHGVPFLGTCGGFQHALLEFARNALGRADAAHAELDPQAVRPVVGRLATPMVDRRGMVRFEPGTRLRALYDRDESEVGYHCSYGLLEPGIVSAFEAAGWRVAARDRDGQVRAMERAPDAFFVGSLFHPERAALDERPCPPARGLLEAALAG